MLVRQPDDKYAAFLVQYKFSDQDKDNYFNGIAIPDLNEKTTAKDLNRGCVPDIYVHCYYSAEVTYNPIQVNNGDLDDHWPAPSVSVVYTLIDCDYTVAGCGGYEDWGSGASIFTGHHGGGGATPGSTPSNPGGPPLAPGDEGITDGDGNLLLTPVILKKTSPCDELEKMSLQTSSVIALQDLQTKTGETIEYGYAQRKNQAGTGLEIPDVIGQNPLDPNELNIAAYIGGTYFALHHTHPDFMLTAVAPMFTPRDIRTLGYLTAKYSYAGTQPNYSEFVVTLTVKDGTDNKTFALKIKDMTVFMSPTSPISDDVNFLKFKKELEDKYSNSGINGSLDDFKKNILSVFAQYGIQSGIGLYETDSLLSNWSEITYNPLTHLLSNNPCK